MKLSIRSLALIPCVAAFLTVAGSAQVTNGDFSSGLSGWTATPAPPAGGTTPGIGITVITLGANATPYGDNIPDINGATNGVYFVDDNANETLSQSVNLAAATTYDLTFDLFSTESGSGNEFNFQLIDGVGTLASQSFGDGTQAGFTAVPVGSWTLETLQFTTVGAGPYSLDFAYTSGPTPAKDLVLTNVAIASTVPEPGSFILLGTGLLAAAGMVRRRLAV